MTGYQVLIMVIFILWPFAIAGLLFFMNKLEDYVKRIDAETPEQAGLEPVEGEPLEREVKVVFGGKVVGESDG